MHAGYSSAFCIIDTAILNFDLLTEYSLMGKVSWWTIPVASLVIVLSAVLILSCGQTERISHRSGSTLYSRDYRHREGRFPFKRNRLRCVRCVNENRKKRKRLRWQAANHGCHCFDRAFLLAGACVCCVKISPTIFSWPSIQWLSSVSKFKGTLPRTEIFNWSMRPKSVEGVVRTILFY